MYRKMILPAFACLFAVLSALSFGIVRRAAEDAEESERIRQESWHTQWEERFWNALNDGAQSDSGFPLTQAQMTRAAEQCAVYLPKQYGIRVLCDGAVLTERGEVGDSNAAVADVLSATIREDGQALHLQTVSCMTVQWSRLEICMESDLSDIRSAYEQRIFALRWICLGVAALSVGVLSLLWLPFGIRHRRLDSALHAVASGGYDTRLSPTDGSVDRSTAQAFNEMADSFSSTVERLEGIARARQRFVDALAHEMKTPLTSILCFADLLRIRRVVPDEEREEQAGIITEEAKRLRDLSGKLLELASSSEGELTVEKVYLPAFLDEVRISCEAVLAKRKQTLQLRPARCTVEIDRELFKSLLYNLVDNASKASPEGGTVMLHCFYKNREAVISVIDRGIGMTAEQQKHMFEPFYMADKSRSRKSGGAGLGLSLCAEIAKRHRARIQVKSVPGQGTVISLRMPARSGDAKGGAQ